MNPVALALVPAVATGLGALPALLVRRLTPPVEAGMLGFGAGMMLAASFQSLLAPAIEQLTPLQGAGMAAVHAVAALLVGAAVIAASNRWMPHEHFFVGPPGGDPTAIRRTWLFVATITLHNVPEGLAVGVGIGSGVAAISVPVAVGIALQNIPEGLVVAMSLLRVGWSRGRSVGIGVGSGLVEPVAAGLGYLAVATVTDLLPYALAAAAGAMVYVVSGEIIPESHRGPASEPATWGTLLGFAAMTLLVAWFSG
jgi:zinc transporter, ZIP family